MTRAASANVSGAYIPHAVKPLTLCKLSQPRRRVNGFAPKHSASAHISAARSAPKPPETEAFQVRSMRKKIHARQTRRLIMRLERLGVPRQRGRVAGYIEDAPGAQLEQAVQNSGRQSGARRIGQHRIPGGGPVAPQTLQQNRRVTRFITAVRQTGLFRIAPGQRHGAPVVFQAHQAFEGGGRQLARRAHAAVQIQQG